MQRVGEHAVPAGPLAVRWLAYELGPVRAGALAIARIALENAGSARWRQARGERVHLSYHWLDERGNPIVWDGLWRPLERDVDPGGQIDLRLHVRAPTAPGRFLLAFDLVDEARCWFAEVGSHVLELAVEVGPRIPRALAARVRASDPETERALAEQEEALVPEAEAAAVAHLAAGCIPAPDWSRRLLDAHQEGFAAVGPALEGGRALRRLLSPWRPGGGRNPNFGHPLLCPSIVTDLEPSWLADLGGLPALERPSEEPWIYDGRIVVHVRARPRSGRPRA